jgi:PKD repeat protein
MFVAVVATLAVLAPGAGAVLVHVGHGQVAGVTPIKGVNPASIPGSFAKRGLSANPFSTNGNLDYHGGPVVHSSAPYLIFWDPSSAIPSAEKTDLENYFADSAADSGRSTNVFGVDRQFTDSSGFANYAMTWASSHAITDTQAYPTTGNCTATPVYSETVCLTDSQLQAEVARLVAADGLPTDGTSGALTANAPIYEVVTPPSVNSCFDSPPNTQCADNTFCAYHSSFTNGGGALLLYANIATVIAANNPKSCQFDNNPEVQEPNGNQIGDVTTKYMSHETNETITDPQGTAWWDSASGNEDGDNCNFWGATVDPQGSSNPNAFEPTLGGTAAGGDLYDQVINGGHFYTQTEWSNGNVNCEAQPAAAALSAAFTAPATAAPSTSISFNPSTSSSTQGYTSTTWNWGDGSSSFSTAGPTTISHTFAVAGNYTVTLTLVDTYGNLSTVSHSIDISSGPVASFTFSPPHPQVNTSVSVDGSGSTDNGGTITSYTWDWGDGSANSTGVTQSHTYTSPGTYTITLTVSDGTNSANTTHSVKVDAVPVAAFSVTTAHPIAGSSVAFTGSASNETGGSIASYSWNFGDGSAAGTGATPSHTYSASGMYTVALTVIDQDGYTGTVTHTVNVGVGPVAAFTSSPPHPLSGTSVAFDGSGSTDDVGTISSYTWGFGDGSSAGTGVTPSHTYAAGGTYMVTLTVSDGTYSKSITHSVLVDSPPAAAFSVTTAQPIVGSPVAFNGSASNEPGGSIVSYSWNFGDGSAAGTGATPSHTYSASGPYTVGLTVTDQDGHTATVSHTVNVASTAPAASFTSSPSHPLAHTSVSFDGSGSTDTGGTLSSYTWDFGDGTNGSGITTTHTYGAPGNYSVTLTVSDGMNSANTTHTVSVHGAPAAAFSVAPAHPTAGSATSFNGAASSESGGTIASYSWTFGDGSSGTGISPSHVYSKAGSYSVSLTVTDGFGGTASTSKTAVVSGVPTAKLTVQTAHPVVGGTTAFSGASSTDTGSTITSYKWTFGDGSSGSGATVNHKYTKAGKFNVTLTITDASGAGAAAGTTVTVTKRAGIASTSIKTGKKVEQVKFGLTAAGTLKVGSAKFKIKHAGAFTFKYKLSKSQLKKLHSHHSLTIKLKATFTPSGGKPSSKTITIKIKS